jgi:hypothetical protein
MQNEHKVPHEIDCDLIEDNIVKLVGVFCTAFNEMNEEFAIFRDNRKKDSIVSKTKQVSLGLVTQQGATKVIMHFVLLKLEVPRLGYNGIKIRNLRTQLLSSLFTTWAVLCASV